MGVNEEFFRFFVGQLYFEASDERAADRQRGIGQLQRFPIAFTVLGVEPLGGSG